MGARGGAAEVDHDGVDFSEVRSDGFLLGEDDMVGSKNPHPFNRQFIYLARGANVKTPWRLVFIRRVGDSPYWAQKPRSTVFEVQPDTVRQEHGIRRENPPCNAEDYKHAGLIVIEAWFGGY